MRRYASRQYRRNNKDPQNIIPPSPQARDRLGNRPPVLLFLKRCQNTRRRRATATADLEPPRGFALRVGTGGRLSLGRRARLTSTTTTIGSAGGSPFAALWKIRDPTTFWVFIENWAGFVLLAVTRATTARKSGETGNKPEKRSPVLSCKSGHDARRTGSGCESHYGAVVLTWPLLMADTAGANVSRAGRFVAFAPRMTSHYYWYV